MLKFWLGLVVGVQVSELGTLFSGWLMAFEEGGVMIQDGPHAAITKQNHVGSSSKEQTGGLS